MTVMHKMAAAMLLATLGALGGFVYARLFLPPEIAHSKTVLAMYVSLGAAVAILSARLLQIFALVFREYRARRPK